MDLHSSDFEDKVKERAYYMYLNNELDSDEERYYTALLIQTFVEEDEQYDEEYDEESNEENPELESEPEPESEPEGEYWCEVCDEDFHNKSDIIDCCYETCKNCLKKYMDNNKFINQRPKYETYKIRCLSEDCPCETISVSDLLTKEEYENIGEVVHINLEECIDDNCRGKVVDNQCQTCHKNICEICHKFEHEGDCNESDLEEMKQIIQHCGTDINICPSCNTVIFSDGGCYQFFCWNCSVMFNWNTKEIMYDEFSFSGKPYYQKFKEDIDNGHEGVRLEHFQPYYQTEKNYFHNGKPHPTFDDYEEESKYFKSIRNEDKELDV